MSDPSSQPTQPLTDADLEDIRDWHNKTRDRRVGALLGELDRLRIQAVRHIDCDADAWAAAARVTRDLRAELDSMTQFAESLRAERDRSVRSCGELGVELDRLRAENTAMREARDGECPRCRFPVWSHDLWKCIPWDMGKHVGDDELRREVVLRELNQGALAGMSSEVTDQAADLVLAALNRYDAWRAEPDPRALGLDQDGRGQANAN